MRWRYVISDGVTAGGGLAGDEALMLPYGRDRQRAGAAATLRLYTYRPHCALVGRYQSVEDEVALDYCAGHGIDVGRRPTGGGAILMGPDQLGVAIAAPAPADETPRRMLRHYAEGIIAGLAGLGVATAFRSKNDLEVEGRKIAGLGLYLDSRGALLFHASVLVDLDVALMLRLLKIPGAKLSDKAVARVEERVTTLSARLATKLTAADIRERFARHLAAALGLDLEQSDFSAAEAAHRDALEAGRYGTREWLFQRSDRQDESGAALLKTPAGLLRIHVGLHGETIKSVLVSGDFNHLPAGIQRLERALKWTRVERAPIERAAAAALGAGDELGVAPAAIAAAIWRAAQNARRRQATSAPRRTTGSCYFPEPANPSKETAA